MMRSTLPGTDVYARDLGTPTPRARRCRFNALTSTDGPITRIWSLPVEEIGHIVHEADLADERYDAPAAAGLDVLIRGLTLTSGSDHDTLTVTGRLFDGLYEHTRRELMTGRSPA